MEIFQLFGSILIKNDKANKEIEDTDKKAKSLGSRLGDGAKKAAKWGTAISGAASVAAGGVMALAAPLVKAAADAQALSAQFEQVFGEVAGSAQDTIDSLGKNFGMLSSRIKPSFTQMTSMFKGLGMDTTEAMTTAESAVTLVADAAAFYDKSFEDANSALNSFIKGNYEGGESIGLFANETQLAAWASKELGVDWKNLDEAGKQVARLEFASAMQEAAGATGQASRESNSLENQLGNLRQAWEDVKAKFGEPILEPAIGWIKQLADWLLAVNFQPMIDGFSAVVNGIVIASQTITEVFGKVVDFLRDAIEQIKSNWQTNGDQLKANFERVFGAIWKTVETIFKAVQSIIEQVLSYIVPWVKSKLDQFQKFWDENGEQIMQAVENAFSSIRKTIEFVMPVIQGIIKGAWAIIQSTFDAAIGIIMGLVKTLASLLTADFKGIKEGLTQIWNSLWEGIEGIVAGAWTLLSGAFAGLWKSISGWFTGLVADAKQWGKDIIQGLIDGIAAKKDAAIAKVKEVGENIADTLKSFFGIASPSKLMKEYGGYIADGLIIGMDGKIAKVAEIAGKLAQAVATPILGIADAVETASQKLSGFTKSWSGSAPRGGGGTIGYNPDGSIAWNSVGSNKSSGGGSSSKGKYVDEDKDGRIDYRENEDGSKTHYAYDSAKSVTQNITINSPKSLSASEVARKLKQTSQKLAMGWGL